MSSAYKIITPVSTEPIVLADAKAHLRIDYTDEDSYITSLITRARSYAETITHRALATQQVQQLFTIDRPVAGDISGSIRGGINLYQFNQELGANPFGPAQYYFDLSLPPIQASQTLLIETRVTVWDAWTTFTSTSVLDDAQEPARLYLFDPVTANQYRFTYTAGYNNSYPIPPDILEAMYELIAYWYTSREGGEDEAQFQNIVKKLL